MPPQQQSRARHAAPRNVSRTRAALLPGVLLAAAGIAFGGLAVLPASAADVATWSGLTGMPGLLASMDDLVRVPAEGVRQPLFDVPGAPVATGDEPAPVRLLGTYDNLWLSHAARDRVTDPEKRKAWMGSNGGIGSTVFVDGMLEGLWRVEDGRPVVVSLFRSLSTAERRELDDELDRTADLLATEG